MKVTIVDIAKKCDVAPSTVSRALNNKNEVSEETRTKILNVAEDMNFKPRKYTKKNVNKKNIYLIFPEHAALPNNFYNNVIKGIEKGLEIDYQKNDFNLIFKSLPENISKNSKIINHIIDTECSGLIIVGPGFKKDIITRFQKENIPLILVDDELWEKNIDCIVNDNINGARKAVNHLIELGHKRIGFIGGPLSHISFDERYNGYKKALKSANITKDNNIIHFSKKGNSDFGFKIGIKILNSVSKIPTAFFVANDEMAVGVIKAIRTKGYRIPKDISIVGFDDIEMSQHTLPPLTTIRIHKKRMGIYAGNRLSELLHKKLMEPVKLVISCRLIIRNSTDKVR